MGLVAGVTRCLSSAVSYLPQGMSAAIRQLISPHELLSGARWGESKKNSSLGQVLFGRNFLSGFQCLHCFLDLFLP